MILENNLKDLENLWFGRTFTCGQFRSNSFPAVMKMKIQDFTCGQFRLKSFPAVMEMKILVVQGVNNLKNLKNLEMILKIYC